MGEIGNCARIISSEAFQPPIHKRQRPSSELKAPNICAHVQMLILIVVKQSLQGLQEAMGTPIPNSPMSVDQC